LRRLVELLLALSILTTFGCQISTGGSTSETRGGQQDSAPQVNAKKLKALENLSDPVVTDLERSRWGNPDAYTELGKQYHLLKTNDGYSETGMASWYGAKFHGRRTSSGQIFDMYQLTAAHKTLPIPVFAKVTNLRNKKETIVLINDRGPFHADRLIDLSFAAAVKLGFYEEGTADVLVETISRVEDSSLFIWIGGFDRKKQALQALEVVKELSLVPSKIVENSSAGFDIQFGPLLEGPEADRLESLLFATDYIPIRKFID
jgi:rare lipoprotein A